jgi:F-type H+-transporting ATPase subunit b
MQIISNIALISINETVIVQLVSFLIFLFIMNRLMFRPLQRAIGDRENHLARLKSAISDSHSEVDKIQVQVKERETAIKQEALKRHKELEDAGNLEASDIFQSIQQEIADLRADVKKDIDAHIQEARKHIEKESQALSQDIMEKLLDRRLAQ